MPRIPSREEPYHSVAKCNRHWKTKREFVTKAANKASHVDGSHYLLVCVTPKGSIEVHASEHFYDDTNQQRGDGVVNWDVLRRRAASIQQKNEERWTEVERQEKRFGIEGQEGDEDEDGDDDENEADTSLEAVDASMGSAPGPGQLMSTFSASKAIPARPINSVTVRPDTLDAEYRSRFEHLGQSVCANVLKAWIKVVEPKKQTKFPYKDKKGNEGRPPPWWPRGMRHIEPDHLHKDERPRLLASIVQAATRARDSSKPASTSPDLRELTVSRLHFATAEIASSIPPRQHYELRQIYLIAKEVRKANEDRARERRMSGVPATPDEGPVWSEITIDFFEKPPAAANAPVKRSYEPPEDMLGAMNSMANKENMNMDYDNRVLKRGKRLDSTPSVPELHHALTPLSSHQNVYAVHSYPVEHAPHSASGYANWPAGVTPISVPPTASTASAHFSQTAYYRPLVADMSAHYSSAASNAGTTAASTTPPSSTTPALQYNAQNYPQHGSQGAYGYSQQQLYNAQSNYQQSTGYAAQTTPQSQSQGTPTTASYAHSYTGYDTGTQGFVSDLAGLSA